MEEGKAEREPGFTLSPLEVADSGRVLSIACSFKLVALGTATGRVGVVDHLGNDVSGGFQRRHGGAVAALNFAGGNFGDDILVSVGSDDGMLIATEAFPGSAFASFKSLRHKVPTSAALTSVAADPMIDSAAQGKRFAVGCSDGKLLIHTASWFIGSDSTLREGEGAINSLAWKGCLLAWATPTRARAFDMTLQRGVCAIDIAQWQNTEPPLAEDTVLVPKSASAVAIHRPHERRRTSGADSAPPPYLLCIMSGQVIKLFEVHADSRKIVRLRTFLRAEISPQALDDVSIYPFLALVFFGESQIATLATSPSKAVLQLSMVDTSDGSFRSSSLTRHGDGLSAQLAAVPGAEPLLLACEGGRATWARLPSPGERMQWLAAHEQFSQAVDVARTTPPLDLRGCERTVEELGRTYLQRLERDQCWEELTRALPTVISATTPPFVRPEMENERSDERKSERWTHWVERFIHARQIALLAEHLPTTELKLPPEVYDKVIASLAEQSPQTLGRVLRVWNPALYDMARATRLLEERLSRRAEGVELREALLLLYAHSNRHVETLTLLLDDRSARVFQNIRAHGFYEAIRRADRLRQLYAIDEDETTKLLAQAPESSLPVASVVQLLQELGEERRLFNYLHAVINQREDAAAEFHRLALPLYCKFGARGSLLRFLRTSAHYSLEEALEAMRSAAAEGRAEGGGGGAEGGDDVPFVRERVFVLSRMGALNQAMDLLLDEARDMRAAVDFAKEHDDAQLWERLVDLARSNSEVMSYLLDLSARQVDAQRLLLMLDERTRVPQLEWKLQRMLREARIEREIREICADALRDDVRELTAQLELLTRAAL